VGRVSGRVVDAEIRLASVRMVVWHQGPPRRDCTGCADPAVTSGRYHRLGTLGAWYSSDTARGAWAEQLRHTLDPLPSPFEVRRKIGRVRVTADRVLDLTDADVRRALGVSETELVRDDVEVCQDLGALAVASGASGICAPSAALQDRKTLVVFAPYLKAVTTVETSRIQRMPSTIADVADHVSPVPEASLEMVQLLKRLAVGGREAVRRLRE
jgi:RES domain-containing protein